jgi:hypothetical protein
MKPAKTALEKAKAELDRLEGKSDELFKVYRSTYYRRVRGELKTDRALDVAHEDMEAAVVEAGNAYKALRQQG